MQIESRPFFIVDVLTKMEQLFDKFFDSVANLFSGGGGDEIPWCDGDVIHVSSYITLLLFRLFPEKIPKENPIRDLGSSFF